MSEVLPDDELVTITLSVAEWAKVGDSLIAIYGVDDPVFQAVRWAVANGN